MDWPFANNDAMFTTAIQATLQNLGWPMSDSKKNALTIQQFQLTMNS